MPGLADGPLRVLPANPICFTADGVSPVFLSGAHTWANLQDFGGPSPDFRFVDYLDMLARDDHNVIRLWTWRWVLVLSRDQDPTWRAPS